jgi:hypothetical protein
MAVITSRQQGLRPETIRTRLARFMPSRSASGWSVTWSAGIEHADEITDEHELRTAEHLGCYGSAVAHALAQAELAPQRLRLTADATTSPDTGQPIITIEVRAGISGPAVDQAMFDAIIHRAEPSCPVLKGLASEVTLRLVAVLDNALSVPVVVTAEPAAASSAKPAAKPASMPPAAAAAATVKVDGQGKAVTAKQSGGIASMLYAVIAQARAKLPGSAARAHQLPGHGQAHAKLPGRGMAAPKWLTTRMAVLLVVAFGAAAAVPAMWHGPA